MWVWGLELRAMWVLIIALGGMGARQFCEIEAGGEYSEGSVDRI